MLTVLKVRKRDALKTYDDPGWYVHPEGGVVGTATPGERERDGIVEPRTQAPSPDPGAGDLPHHDGAR